MVVYPQPPFFCNRCAAKVKALTLCQRCGLDLCSACYKKHARLEQKAGRQQMITLAGERAVILRDIEGTPAPAAANPFIFKRGTGRPDEPPEAAGAPNRPRVQTGR